jgi:ABC-type amino acid transport substrate-binding protein
MKRGNRLLLGLIVWACIIGMWTTLTGSAASGADLPEILQRGVLRHLGVPYANFVTGSGDGLDVELVKLFARDLGVRYEFVQTAWKDVIGDLVGKNVNPNGGHVELIGKRAIRGDIIASGLTILPWRQKVVDYSTPTFPTQVWLLARADSAMRPINPSGDINRDIGGVKAMLKGLSVLGMANTCLDPALYGLSEVGAQVILFDRSLNELAPAVIKGDAEATMLDAPDALIALEKWPGKIKVIGPVSPMQEMGCAFAKKSPLLREAFNRFFMKCKKDGTYQHLVKKYYPAVFRHYAAFFGSGD